MAIMYAEKIPSEPSGIKKRGSSSLTKPRTAYAAVWNSARRLAIKTLSVSELRLTVAMMSINATLCQLVARSDMFAPSMLPMTTYAAAAAIVTPPTISIAAFMSALWSFDFGKKRTRPEFSPSRLRFDSNVVMDIRAEAIPI